MIGQTISHYRILEHLGGGGMGVVYKAEDTKLKRAVALKFLPPELTRDPEAKERFMHEAQAASALDHINICTVFEIGETNEGQLFIAMPCYEGETLKEKIARGTMNVNEVVDISAQIAEGLQKAHEKGIVHRDVKPANILITTDGVAKIVDFGLAKVRGATKLTKTGSTLGTIGYMAPEQIRGGEVDARADIFSLGVVLYEMLAGKTPFRGDHEAALMYSILSDEPEPIEHLVPGLSKELAQVVSCALEKDPGKRYQSMNEVTTALKEFAKESPEMRGKGRLSPHKRRYSTRILIVGGCLLIAYLACLVVFMETHTSKRTAWESAKARHIKTPSAVVSDPDISPDGNWIVYVARDQKNQYDNLYVVPASGGDSKKATNDTNRRSIKMSPCFSLDASEIIYGQWENPHSGVYERNIYKVSTLGGQSRKIVSNGSQPVVSPDGRHIAFMRFISRIPYIIVSDMEGGAEKVVIRDSLTYYYEWCLAWSPDGKRIAHLHNFGTSPDQRYREIFTCDVATGEERQMTFEKTHPGDICWTPRDEFVYADLQGQSSKLMVIPVSGGAPVRLTFSAGSDYSPRVSRDGKRLVYLNTSLTSNLWAIDLETKEMNQITFEDDIYIDRAKYSPDGRRILYMKSSRDAPSQLFVCNIDGTETIQVTDAMYPSRVFNSNVFWAGDGRAIAYTVSIIDTAAGNPDSVSHHILVQDISTRNVEDHGEGMLEDWSQDGMYMLVAQEWNAKKHVLAPSHSLDKPTRVIESPSVSFTRDSKSVIYTDSAYIWSLSIKNGQVTRLRKRPLEVLWPSEMPDGKSLFVATFWGSENKWKVFKISRTGSQMEKLCDLQAYNISGGDVSPDMKKVVFSRYEKKDNVILLDNSK